MKARLLALLCAVTLVTVTSGCYTLTHTVGDGPIEDTVESDRQWYYLWGLVQMGTVDSGDLATGASDYTIETKWGFMDMVMNLFAGFFFFTSRTITVTI